MIDLSQETALPLVEAIEKATKRRVHASSAHRWRLRGCRGVRLETAVVGGRRVTSVEAVLRFVERTTAAADGELAPNRTDKRREREIAAAEKELEEMLGNSN